ncbi:hypothetical protein [Bacillus tuaregi]|uniref:hypothetical protein n=1 Tax=Bacillus tuaregi TaxID=1816695 RepID=UPI0008F80E79|nr:hypothetical protein [Bacillus tuaregi]
MSNRKLSISFKRKYHDVYVFLNHLKDNKENVSDYICGLVKADMNKENTQDTFIQDEVRKVVIETLLAGNLPLNQLPDNKVTTLNEDNQRSEDIDLLNQLF